MARSRHTILGGTAQFTAAVDVSFELTLAILAVANRLFRTSREVAMNHANAVKAFVSFPVKLTVEKETVRLMKASGET